MESEDQAFDEIKLAVDSWITDREFWHSRAPQERIWAMELMRRKKYGYDENSIPRLQRVIEFAKLRRYNTPDDPKNNGA